MERLDSGSSGRQEKLGTIMIVVKENHERNSLQEQGQSVKLGQKEERGRKTI